MNSCQNFALGSEILFRYYNGNTPNIDVLPIKAHPSIVFAAIVSTHLAHARALYGGRAHLVEICLKIIFGQCHYRMIKR